MNLFSRRIVSWELSNNIDSQMVSNAINKAISDDNSSVEFFFHTLKIEWLNDNQFAGFDNLYSSILEYIDQFTCGK